MIQAAIASLHAERERDWEEIAALYGERITPDHVLTANGAIGANFLALYALVEPGTTVVSVQPRVTNRTDYSGSEDRTAPAAATGASRRVRPCFAPRSKASNTSPQGGRNR